jgi:serine/threonine protein kinase
MADLRKQHLDGQEKSSICFQIAKILNTLHHFIPPICHGHLSSHNVFLELTSANRFKVRIGDLEMIPLYKVANTFGDYRNSSVWSSPECLQNLKKVLDPTPEMDVYSFSMLMWEIWHDTVPFEGDLHLCQKYVVTEDSRPSIDTELVDPEYTKLIRLCW